MSKIIESIRTIPNFPKEGILFRDMMPVLENPEVFNELIASMSNLEISQKRDQQSKKTGKDGRRMRLCACYCYFFVYFAFCDRSLGVWRVGVPCRPSLRAPPRADG